MNKASRRQVMEVNTHTSAERTSLSNARILSFTMLLLRLLTGDELDRILGSVCDLPLKLQLFDRGRRGTEAIPAPRDVPSSEGTDNLRRSACAHAVSRSDMLNRQRREGEFEPSIFLLLPSSVPSTIRWISAKRSGRSGLWSPSLLGVEGRGLNAAGDAADLIGEGRPANVGRPRGLLGLKFDGGVSRIDPIAPPSSCLALR